MEVLAQADEEHVAHRAFLWLGKRHRRGAAEKGPDLNGAYLEGRVLGGPADRLVDIRTFQDVVTGHLFLGLGEGAIGHDQLTLAGAHRCRVRARA